jgi:nucleoside-diphosphate-sugar epimerase
MKGFRAADLMRVNRDGARRLLEACRDHAPGLACFTLVSSLAAGGPSPGGAQARSEDDPPRPVSWYGRSKLEAERAVLASGLPSVILRPPVVFGPGDRDVLGCFRLARRGWLPVPAGGRRYSVVYAPDLADGVVRAAQAPCPSGQVFHLTGPDLPWAEFARRIAAALGRRGRVLPLPGPLVRVCGRGADLWARLRRRPGIFSSQKVAEMLAPGWVASPDKARRLLGWEAPTGLDEALAATVAWYRDHGWI